MNVTKPLLIAATVATIGVIGVGATTFAHAEETNNSGGSSLVDKLAAKFNLNKDEVKAVFDAEHKVRQAEHAQDAKERLDNAVKDGALTQEQADHIQAVFDEIKALHGDTNPRELSDDIRDQIRDKMDELRSWAEENDIDMRQIGFMHHQGHHAGPREEQ